jgi:hypothetical protein
MDLTMHASFEQPCGLRDGAFRDPARNLTVS